MIKYLKKDEGEKVWVSESLSVALIASGHPFQFASSRVDPSGHLLQVVCLYQ